MRNMRTRILALAALMGIAVAATAVAQNAGGLAHGRGRLKVIGEPPAAQPHAPADGPAERPQRLTVQVTRNDDNAVISGPVTITGIPFAGTVEIGDVDWTVAGAAVTGVVTGKAGNPIAAFEGTVAQGVVTGTFTLANGKRATWSWDGPPPQ